MAGIGSLQAALTLFPIECTLKANREATAENTHGGSLVTESTTDFAVFLDHGDGVKDVPVFVPELMDAKLNFPVRQNTIPRGGASTSHRSAGHCQEADMGESLVVPQSAGPPVAGWASSQLPQQQVADGFALDGTALNTPMNALRERALAGMGLSGCTTVMIRNIPTTFTQKDLMQELCNCRFGGTFDFIYVPADSRKRKNRGIAFVNFTSASAASEFYHGVHGTKSSDLNGAKEIFVTPADVQGYEENVRRFAAELAAKKEVVNLPILLRPTPQVGPTTALPQIQRRTMPMMCRACQRPMHFSISFSFCPFCGAPLT